MLDIRTGGRGSGKTSAMNKWINERELETLKDIKTLFDEMDSEQDEDCIGIAFFKFRASEDLISGYKNSLNRIIKRHSQTRDVPDTTCG